MNKRKILCLLLAAVLLLAAACFASCAQKDPRMKESEAVEQVKKALFPEIELVSAKGSGELKTYTFRTVPEGKTFEVLSYVYLNEENAPTEELLIYYERDMITSEENLAARANLAASFGVSEEMKEQGRAVVTAKNYRDIDRLAGYIAALDAMYAFKVAEPDRCVPASVGTISFGTCSIQGPDFSTSDDARLSKEAVKETLVHDYVVTLKRFGATDSSVPDYIWDSILS